MRNLVCAGLVVAACAGVAGATQVNIELSLLVDVSGSISTSEYNLQRQGYANAFSNANFFSSVIGAGHSVAVNFVEWSGATEQSELVGWTLIASQADANAFAAAILAPPRPFNGNTAPGSAINFAYPRIFNNSFTSDKQIIDVSGDGVANTGADTATARNAALAAGVDQINGLVIGGDQAVFNFYNNNIKGGANAFVNTAATFNDFGAAIQEKLQLEITQALPLPSAAGMGLAGLLVVGVRRRRA